MAKNEVNRNRVEMGSRLRMAREMSGLSQAQVANMLSLHRPSISEMEAGRRKVSAEELYKLAEIYDVKLDWLAGSDSGDKPEEEKRIKLAARQLAKLKPKDRKRVLYLLKLLQSNEGENQ
jgi:transcriptional regulator with XRE-family HTH domain